MMISILSSELLDDLRAAAFIESELHAELDLHHRHEMADICETDNIDRVWRVLALAAAEVRIALSRNNKRKCCDTAGVITNRLLMPDEFRFHIPCAAGGDLINFLKETIHDYMIARVMADRTAVIIPVSAPVWKQRSDAALASLREAAVAAIQPLRPILRPLFP